MKKAREIIWVCVACGKWNEDRDKLSDVSCYINAVPCYKDRVDFRKDGTASQVLKGGIVDTSIKKNSCARCQKLREVLYQVKVTDGYAWVCRSCLGQGEKTHGMEYKGKPVSRRHVNFEVTAG